MPIKQVSFDGKSIRSSLGITEFEKAKEIEKYNEQLVSDGMGGFRYNTTFDITTITDGLTLIILNSASSSPPTDFTFIATTQPSNKSFLVKYFSVSRTTINVYVTDGAYRLPINGVGSGQAFPPAFIIQTTSNSNGTAYTYLLMFHKGADGPGGSPDGDTAAIY